MRIAVTLYDMYGNPHYEGIHFIANDEDQQFLFKEIKRLSDDIIAADMKKWEEHQRWQKMSPEQRAAENK